MRFTSTAAILGSLVGSFASPYLEKRVVSQSFFDELVRYTKYSSAAYQSTCPNPLGTTLVRLFSSSSTRGYISRDDSRREIVIAFSSDLQTTDFISYAEMLLVPLRSPGVSDAGGAHVHTGFLDAYNSVASTILSTLRSQLDANPDYVVISAGHSMGGALASLGGVSIKANIPESVTRVYTFGQPRTGDPAYASLVENTVGTSNIVRAVHTFDGVPTLFPQAMGYRHHATEYWNFLDPATPTNVRQCSGQEDPTCSDFIPSTGVNPAHLVYFNQIMGQDPTLCT